MQQIECRIQETEDRIGKPGNLGNKESRCRRQKTEDGRRKTEVHPIRWRLSLSHGVNPKH